MVTVTMTHLPQGHTITPSHRAPQSHKVTTVHMESYSSYPLHKPNQLTQSETLDPPVPPLHTLRTPMRSRVLSGRLRLLTLHSSPSGEAQDPTGEGRGWGWETCSRRGPLGNVVPSLSVWTRWHPALRVSPYPRSGPSLQPCSSFESLPEIFEIQTQAQSDAPTRGRSHTLETSFLQRPCRSGRVTRSLRNKKRWPEWPRKLIRAARTSGKCSQEPERVRRQPKWKIGLDDLYIALSLRKELYVRLF